jgi:hypothetical protein
VAQRALAHHSAAKVGLEAAKPTKLLLSSNLTEPRANQQGKRFQIYQKPR